MNIIKMGWKESIIHDNNSKPIFYILRKIYDSEKVRQFVFDINSRCVSGYLNNIPDTDISEEENEVINTYANLLGWGDTYQKNGVFHIKLEE